MPEYSMYHVFTIFKLMEKIKLIWDFRSADALKIAEHHVKHINEFLKKESHTNEETGISPISELYCTAFLITTKDKMVLFRDKLKPHRGEVI